MNSTHAAVGAAAGVGGTSVTTALTILLTGWNGLTPDRAGAAAFLITTVIGTIAGVATAWYAKPVAPSAPPAA